jgi:DNA-binding NtrC family response regulator
MHGLVDRISTVYSDYDSCTGPSCQGGFSCINERVMPATILLVEDNSLSRRNMMIFFKTHGYDVLEAQRGEEALKLIRDVDNFDVVMTDLRMPGMVDGLEVLRVQNEVSPGTKLFW